MRRLITWIAILMGCISLLLVGVRVIRPTPASTACVQLLSPTTGYVLIIDATIGAYLPDARAPFPMPFNENQEIAFSSDQKYVLNRDFRGKLWLIRRSTIHRRALTSDSAATLAFSWSPAGQHFAYIEMSVSGNGRPVLNLVLANSNGSNIQREFIADNLDISLRGASDELVWSPDGTIIASMFEDIAQNTGSFLALRSVQSTQSMLVPLPVQQIEYATWSPDSQVIVVFTHETSSPSVRSLFVVQRDGQILKRTPLSSGFQAVFQIQTNVPLNYPALGWSPDGQYFYVLGLNANKYQADVFDRNGQRMLTAPITLGTQQGLVTWMNLPHTMLYISERNDEQSTVVMFEPQTAQSTALIGAMPKYSLWLVTHHRSSLVVTVQNDQRFALHWISLTSGIDQVLLEDTGIPIVMGESFDKQYLMLMAETSDSSLLWWRHTNGDVHFHAFPKQQAETSSTSARWLMDNKMFVIVSRHDISSGYLLDTQTANILPVSPLPESRGNMDAWSDGTYLVVDGYVSANIYRSSDGQLIYSITPSQTDFNYIYSSLISRQASLIRKQFDQSTSHTTLSIVTPRTTFDILRAIDLRRPAWSPDGERLAVVLLEDQATTWRLKILAQDGTVLRTFPLPMSFDDYLAVRWTNCD